jgi:hypothetical protein
VNGGSDARRLGPQGQREAPAPLDLNYGSTRQLLANAGWRAWAESNYGSSPYHLGAKKSIGVIGRSLAQVRVSMPSDRGHLGAMRLLPFAAAT